MKLIKCTLMIVTVLGVATTGTPVFAQSIDEIVVTARRQSETLRDVPATVSVITADTLEKTGAIRADDFLELIPGVTIVTNTAEAGDTQINIRGINGARDAESSVALVVDGVLKTNTAQLNQNHGVLRQVEVLKGPQGAIYGRNAAAGAIVLTTAKPSNSFESKSKAGYGEYDSRFISSYASGPINDQSGYVASFYYSATDGSRTNSFTGQDSVDNQETIDVNGRYMVSLSPSTNLDIKARYANVEGASINFNAVFHLVNLASVPGFYEDVNDHRYGYYSNITPENEQDTGEFSVKLDHDFGNAQLTTWALYNKIDQNLSADGTSADLSRYWAAATFLNPSPTATGMAAAAACQASVTANTGFALNQPGVIGTSPTGTIFDPANGSLFGAYSPTTCDGTQYQEREQEDISIEIRLASNTDDPLSWQVGGYYLNLERSVGVSLAADLGRGIIKNLYNDANSDNPTSQLYHDQFDTEVTAIFGSVDYAISERTDVGLALRYDIEDRQVTNLVPLVPDPITGGLLNPGQSSGAIAPQSERYQQLQPKLSISHDVYESNTVYANWGVGFKSGGFNNSGSEATVTTAFNVPGIDADIQLSDQYRKETSDAFEIGLKGVLGNGINYDLAAYYTSVEDMQFFEFFVGTFGLLRVVSNIDEVELYGGEVSISKELIEGLTLLGSFNATESEIKKNSSRTYTVGNKSPHTPDYTANLGLQYERPIPILSGVGFVFRADYRLTGETYFHTVQEQNQTRPTLFSALFPGSPLDAAFGGFLDAASGNADYSISQRDSYGILNLRTGVEGNNWSVIAYANNLTDEEYVSEVITAIEFGGSFISPGSERQIGVEVSYNF